MLLSLLEMKNLKHTNFFFTIYIKLFLATYSLLLCYCDMLSVHRKNKNASRFEHPKSSGQKVKTNISLLDKQS